MTSSKAAPVSDGQNVEQGHMAYDVKKIRQETSLSVLHQEKDHVCELYLKIYNLNSKSPRVTWLVVEVIK